MLQYELLRDYKALNTLRELLVIIRIWGLLRQSCLPVFVRSAENLDVLGLLFRLLSRLIQTSEPDENLLGNTLFTYRGVGAFTATKLNKNLALAATKSYLIHQVSEIRAMTMFVLP
jgi:hypothetical protein